MVWNAFTKSARWDTWGELDRLFFDLPTNGSRTSPPIELWTGAEGLLLHARLPGLSPENIELTVVGDTLSLQGTRPSPDASDGESWHRRERETGRFHRTIQLPFAVEGDRVQAQFQGGVLSVKLPRAASERPRKITVETT